MNPYLMDVASAMKPPIAREGGGDVQGAAPAWVPSDPLAVIPNQNAPGAGTFTGYDPLKDHRSAAGQAIDAAMAPPPAPPAPPQAAQPQGGGGQTPAISLASAGGMTPAHEASRLGPTQWAALDASNQAQQQAIGGMAVNSLGQAQRDEDVYLRHAMDARAREDAATQVANAREDELRMRASDFDRQARALSQEKLDPGRLWASKSAPQKVATFISIALGGFLSGAKGGENLAMQRVNEEIERDVKAQEFSFHAKRAGVEASQTAYGMALQRYQSADAARAFARVSAMDAVAAEIQRQQAQGKGTDVANRAQAALAELQQARADQILKGIAYIPSSYTGPTYRVANRLGTYTAREIDDKQIAPEEARGFELQKIDRTADGKVREERAKATAKGDEDKDKRWVPTSSTGKGYYAPTEKEGTEHREQQANTQEVLDLIDRIKTNTGKLGYTGRVASATGYKGSDAKKVEADSIALIGALNRMQKFGALDKGAQDLLGRMSGDPMSVIGNDAQLDQIKLNAIEKRRQLEKSSTGAKPSMAPEGSQGGGGKQAW